MQEEINEVEFKQNVMKKLESGILVKLKAQLRAHIYNLLENEENEESSTPVKLDSLDSLENSSIEDNKRNKTVPSQEQINQLLSEDSCSLALFVVQDLLDALNLSYTSAVFKSETGNISNKYLNKTKDDVLNELNLNLNSGEYKCSPEINGDTVNQSDNESSLNSSMKKFDKDQPILLQLLNNYKMSPNNSDIFNNQDNQVKMNVTTVISSNAEHKE